MDSVFGETERNSWWAWALQRVLGLSSARIRVRRPVGVQTQKSGTTRIQQKNHMCKQYTWQETNIWSRKELKIQLLFKYLIIKWATLREKYFIIKAIQISNRNIEFCSYTSCSSLAYTQMQINTAVICLHTTIKTAKIRSKIIDNKWMS